MIVWLASYPKSGNTLLRSILGTYLFSKDGNLKFDYLYKIEQFPLIKQFEKLNIDIKDDKKIFENFINAQSLINKDKKIRFFKTHSSLISINNCNFTDSKNSLGAIYIVRDPRNVVTSLSHHYNINIDEAINTMINPSKWLFRADATCKTFLGSWSVNYNSWKNMGDKVLTIKYEDLVTRKKSTLIKIFKFIQKLGVKDFEINMIKLNKIIKTSDFNIMQDLEKKTDFKEAELDEKTKKRKTFFKYGPKNDWRRFLKREYSSKIEETFRKEMIELGYL